MADKELADLLSALDTPSSAKPGPVPAGLSVGKAVFSDGRPVPKHAVKVMLDVSAPLKPMTATTVNAGSSAPPATATAPAGAKYTPAPAKPAAKASGGDDIDAILGAMNFDEDADVSIGFCASCRGGITKKQQHLNVFGNRYHIQHFNCSNCKVNIGNNAFYEKPAGSPLCQGCYSRHHATNCAKCRKQITERECVRVDELKYHPHCFTCTTCNIPLSIYWERNGQPVCEKHYTERYTPRCCDCSQPIIGRILTAMGGERHPTCFKCSMCSSQIKTEEFFNNNGMPVCLKCDPRRR